MAHSSRYCRVTGTLGGALKGPQHLILQVQQQLDARRGLRRADRAHERLAGVAERRAALATCVAWRPSRNAQ